MVDATDPELLPLASCLRAIPKHGRPGAKLVASLIEDDEASALRPILLAMPAVQGLLAAIAEASPFLWRLIQRDPAGLAELLRAPIRHSLHSIREAMIAAGETGNAQRTMQVLRRNRMRSALLIGLGDLGGVLDTVAVTRALSDFADASVVAALRFALRTAETAGSLHFPDPENPEQGLGLFILALGKHGAQELNYSSDIDLSIFYEPEAPGFSSAADHSREAVSIVKTIVKLLNERTADGFVQRVDLRLRPDPGLTPIAMPCEAAIGYYESVGQNWERAAMIKARVVAGDAKAGNSFLKELAPFIWRKYFDYGAIADIHAMKRQIYAVRGHDEIVVPGHDLKLGRGGIREIEFFVQTQQLVYGGRRPSLRGSRTLDMLDELAREGWIAPKAASELQTAYRHLRDLEHRVQMLNDEQTQKLPRSESDLATFAKFCGRSRREFDKLLIKQMRVVEAHYARLFEAVPGLASTSGSLVFTGVEDDPDTLKTLTKLGFRDPSLVAETVRGWHFGRRPAITTPRAREVVTELVPSLLEAFGQSSDPDGALLAFDNALQRLPAAVELFNILKNNADLRRLFAECLGTAPRLGDIVARSPHVLDVLVDQEFAGAGAGDVYHRIAPRLALESDFELFLDRARGLARAERFLIGTRALSGVLSMDEIGPAHTEIAECFLEIVLARVRSEFAVRHGHISGSKLAIIGYGKAGSREITATSDLDLVVLYASEPDAMSDGEKPLMASEYFARLTQRLIAALSAPMRNGILYEIDVRLRPSGKKGPVAVSIEGFIDYQSTEAEVWEHMALSRARGLVGDAPLLERIEAVLAGIVTIRREPLVIRKAVAEMRGLMASEKPGRDAFDVKDWPGGLVDCEFIAQTLTLVHAADHPSLVVHNTGAILAEASRLGLLDATDAEAIAEGWRLQSRLSQALRLFISEAFDEKSSSPVFRRRLASLLDYPDFIHLKSDLLAVQKRIRDLFTRLVGPVALN